jgi:hypothetical protein
MFGRYIIAGLTIVAVIQPHLDFSPGLSSDSTTTAEGRAQPALHVTRNASQLNAYADIAHVDRNAGYMTVPNPERRYCGALR